MPTFTKTISGIAAGRARLECLVDFPSKDATLTGTYLVEISFDSGNTWRTLCQGSIRGDFVPAARAAEIANLIFFSVSHDASACSLRLTATVNKVAAANFTLNAAQAG